MIPYAVTDDRARTPLPASGAGWLTIALLAWGVLSFGAVYPWAFWPLAGAALIAGVWSLSGGWLSTAGASRALACALLALAAAISLQLIPLPAGLLHRISPETTAALQQLNPVFALGIARTHALSIAPGETLMALALYVSFALLMVGASRMPAERLCAGIAVIGALVALIGIVQGPAYGNKIYGFWEPLMRGHSYGSFVNKNHFGGWMLLAIPVTLGLLLSRIERGMRGVPRQWSARLLWFGSPEASKTLLVAACAGVMTLALVLTLSRSAMSALAVALLVAIGFVVRNVGATRTRVAAIVGLVLLVAAAVLWADAATVSRRFGSSNWGDLNNRLGPWSDALAVAQRFPITGTGLNTYGTSMLLFQRHDLGQHYAEAHSDYLQLLAEGGALLVLPALVCIGVFARDVGRRLGESRGSSSYWLRAGAVIGLIAIALQSMVEFSLQMPGVAALFAVTCGIALHRSPQRTRS